MKRVLSLLLVAVVALAAGGCFLYDMEHNRGHWAHFERDIEEAHYDLDMLFYSPQVEGPPERHWAGYY